jgi:hypothetical protein
MHDADDDGRLYEEQYEEIHHFSNKPLKGRRNDILST